MVDPNFFNTDMQKFIGTTIFLVTPVRDLIIILNLIGLYWSSNPRKFMNKEAPTRNMNTFINEDKVEVGDTQMSISAEVKASMYISAMRRMVDHEEITNGQE